MNKQKGLVTLFETMVDDKSSIAKSKREEIKKIADKLILGHSQFNEILLMLGFDRGYPGFFQFLVDGTIEYKNGSAIESLQALESGIERFRTLALLWYGNIKFAFKALSKDPYELEEKVGDIKPWDKNYYTSRHSPISSIDNIRAEKTYFLGYLIADKIKERMKKITMTLKQEVYTKRWGINLKLQRKTIWLICHPTILTCTLLLQ